MSKNLVVGYADFVKLCRVEDSETWDEALSVRNDGVYVKTPPNGLSHGERTALAQHPTGNLNEPAIRLPCSLDELQHGMEQLGIYGCIDAFDMAEWAAETVREKMRGSQRAIVDKANAPGGRSEKTYLNIIGGLLALMLGKSPVTKAQSTLANQDAVISMMLGYYGHIRGMSDSNLEKIMAEANKTLKDSAIPGG